jgi:hypothetical protein
MIGNDSDTWLDNPKGFQDLLKTDLSKKNDLLQQQNGYNVAIIWLSSLPGAKKQGGYNEDSAREGFG